MLKLWSDGSRFLHELNSHIFDELAQDYEDEFSLISEKKKNQDGKYSVDVDWRFPNVGYYWKEGSKIIGFSIVESIDGYSEIVDFYIVPAYRKKMAGKNMAFAVFNKHLGPWRVRQIPGSEVATKFWRRVIADYTNENYTELQIENPPWDLSVCQQFDNQKFSRKSEYKMRPLYKVIFRNEPPFLLSL